MISLSINYIKFNSFNVAPFHSQALVRSRLLRENGKWIPKQAYLMRRNFFNSEEVGYFKTQKRPAPPTNPMTDPNAMSDMLKGNMTNVLPMIIIGGWINWAFSGFVTSRLLLINSFN